MWLHDASLVEPFGLLCLGAFWVCDNQLSVIVWWYKLKLKILGHAVRFRIDDCAISRPVVFKSAFIKLNLPPQCAHFVLLQSTGYMHDMLN